MTNEIIQNEAIVLQALAFKEFDRILTLFSPQGLFKLFAKGKKRHYTQFAALTTPLTHGEFHYTLGRKDLHRLHEGSIINQNLHLRNRYETLQAAEKMALSLLRSQWIGKAAPHLFHLFCRLISYVSKVQIPHSLTTTFLLKIMRHEGLLQLGPPQLTYRQSGERFTPSAAPFDSLPFSIEEEILLTQLAQCRSLTQLASIQLETSFQEKIDILFQQTFN